MSRAPDNLVKEEPSAGGVGEGLVVESAVVLRLFYGCYMYHLSHVGGRQRSRRVGRRVGGHYVVGGLVGGLVGHNVVGVWSAGACHCPAMSQRACWQETAATGAQLCTGTWLGTWLGKSRRGPPRPTVKIKL